MKEGYDFKPTEISFPTWKDTGYESEFTGYTKPFKTNFAKYDRELHLSHKKYINDQIYNLGNIGKAGSYGNNGIEHCDFINCKIVSTNFDYIIMSEVFCHHTTFSDNIYNKVSFEYCHFENTQFIGKSMFDIEFRNCYFKDVEFLDLSMDEFMFYDCKIDDITFNNISPMSRGYFQCSTIDKINFINVNLNHVNVYYSRVKNIKINNVDRKTSEFGFVDNSLTFLFNGIFDKNCTSEGKPT